ncbi:uncharacterized protein L3040_009169 [Drepanopeziza brunnea f. sp. 'multigermtubi']|uniref:uncharacterized protein n=1 Tax=Drepanopeziza brunnea f. sp. 'multigermtubi' TaxID=698441 RepID=UPI00239DB08F|nr:hypothetical protein L3040_009169 [Drepanopeziza brunnea f. sp. 'multigermtubi']
MTHHGDYRQWPFLNPEEFELANAFFEQKYMGVTLGRTRKVFRVRLRRVMTTGESYITIMRLLQPPEDADADELSLALARLSGGGERGEKQDLTIDVDMKMDTTEEEADDEALSQPLGPPRYTQYSDQPFVTYEIHLHPTYRMPTLWFTLHSLPMGEPTFDLDSVYRYLVPTEYKSRLRAAGITGGFSAAPHPITGIPAFFVHPCQTKEAMESFDCSLRNYLMVWLGLVGGCVGLWY